MAIIMSNLNTEIIEARIFAITVVIMVNLILSVWEALKLKKFDIKKLPEFISEWTMCTLSILVIEIILAVMMNEPYVESFIIGIRNVMFVSMIACYLKKIYESLVSLGWDVKINFDKLKNDNNQLGGK